MRPSSLSAILERGIVVAGRGRVTPGGPGLARSLADLPRYRKMDNLTRYAVAAARQALRAAGPVDGEKTGLVIATRYGSLNSVDKFLQSVKKHGLHLASPFLYPNTVMNMAAGMIAICFGLKGPALTLIGGIDEALDEAALLLEQGRAGAVLAGYVEESNRFFRVPGQGATIYLLRQKRKK